MRTETVSFPGRDRKTINCLLYRPDGEARVRPAVFLVPGRPLFPTDYEWLVRPLVEAGLAVVGVYQRGFGSEGVDDRAGPKAISVVRRAVKTFLDKKIVRPPIALVGHSTGAQTALLTAAEESKLDAVVALSPIADLAAHVRAVRNYQPGYEAEQAKFFGEVFEDANDAYRVRSPLHVADKMKCPILLITGQQDWITPPYQADLLRQALQDADKEVRLATIPWVGHFFQSVGFHGYQFERVVEETTQWLTHHLDLPASLQDDDEEAESLTQPSGPDLGDALREAASGQPDLGGTTERPGGVKDPGTSRIEDEDRTPLPEDDVDDDAPVGVPTTDLNLGAAAEREAAAEKEAAAEAAAEAEGGFPPEVATDELPPDEQG